MSRSVRDTAMVIAEKIQQCLQRLPTSVQEEVLDFVEYLLTKVERDIPREEAGVWSDLSLTFAMREMEDEKTPVYTAADLKLLF